MAASAVVFFTVINKNKLTEPEKTVMKYFDAISSGDVATLKTVFASGSQMDEARLKMMGTMFAGGIIKYQDVKLNTLSESATDATVQLDDAIISISLGGQSIKQKISSMYAKGSITFALKNQNGRWVMLNTGNLTPGMPSVPDMPGTSLPSYPGNS